MAFRLSKLPLTVHVKESIWLCGRKLQEMPLYFFILIRDGRSGVRILAGAGDFPLLQNVQTGSGAHPWIPGFFCGEKAAGAWSWPLPDILLVLRLRSSGTIPLSSLYAFVLWTGTALPWPWPYRVNVFEDVLNSVITFFSESVKCV
jgi:hypothetical protein